MRASDLLRDLEEKVPLDIALEGDRVGYIGPGSPDSFDVGRVLVVMDYLPGVEGACRAYDLLVLHHPPPVSPGVPAYVMHSNWDIVDGGAADALARCLGITVDSVLDQETGLGRVGRLQDGPLSLEAFADRVLKELATDDLRIVNFQKERPVGRIGLIPGFGLNPHLIQLAAESGVDLYLSGDLTHPGAVLAANADLVLVDATHHATEVPGLLRLGELIRGCGVAVDVAETGVPWRCVSRERGNEQCR